jgi:hypothetical protein
MATERLAWIHVVKWILVILLAVQLMQLFVSWLTNAG